MAERPKVADAIAVARKGGGRSDIYEWLWNDFEALSPELSRAGVNWKGLAELATSHGLKAGRGSEPTAEVVRQTWHRVRKDKATPPKPPGRPKAQPALVGVDAIKTAAPPAPTLPPPKRQASKPWSVDDDDWTTDLSRPWEKDKP
jgi:hypothetical protein